MLGLPSEETLKQMSTQITQTTIDLVHRLDDSPQVDLAMILPYQRYKEEDIREAADLMKKMLQWVPSQRISCQDALKHKFFKHVKIP